MVLFMRIFRNSRGNGSGEDDAPRSDRWRLKFALAQLVRPTGLRTAVVIAIIATGALLTMPGSWFLKVDAVELVRAPGTDPFIIQRADFRPGGFTRVHYDVELREVGVRDDPARLAPSVCSASGEWLVGSGAFGEMRVPLAGVRPGTRCDLRRGFAYRATVTYRFAILGIPKAVRRITQAVTVAALPPPVAPDLPPSL